jgi:hypothetical protein
MSKQNKEQEMTEQQTVDRIKQNIQRWFDYYRHNIQSYRDDMYFTYLDDGQWAEDSNAFTSSGRRQSLEDGKPRLSFNMLPRILYSLEGEFAENEPDLKVRNTDTIDPDTRLTRKIDIMTDFLRYISFSSRNDEVYRTAFSCATGGGFGAFRIIVKPTKENPFNLMPAYEPIYDPTYAFWDRSAKNIDKSDGAYCGDCAVWKKDEIKAKYPKAKFIENYKCEYSAFENLDKDEVVIADYYEKEFFKKRIALLSNGQVMDYEKAEKLIASQRTKIFGALFRQELRIEAEKEIDDFRIRFYRIAGDQILETSLWDGKMLPMVFQGGIVKEIKGREYTFSVTRWLKDSQRSYNYARNEYLFRLKLTRYEKWLVQVQNIEKLEDAWKNAHLPNAYLPYKPATDGSKPVPIPPSEIPQSLSVEIQHSLNDLQQIVGRFDANIGAASNERSGIAISNRQQAGNLNVKPFFTNAFSAMQTGANIVLDLIPKVIDNQRIVSLLDREGKTSNITVNDGRNPEVDFTEGGFDVEVSVGATFELQKTQAIEQLLTAYKANPQLAQISSDILAKNLDFKDAALLAERAQVYTMPQITMNEEQKKDKSQILQESMQQAQQQQMQQQQMQQQQIQLTQMIATQKMQDDRIKAMSDQMKGLAALMDAQTNREEAKVKGVIESRRLDVEEDRSASELQQQELKTLRELLEVKTEQK